MPVSRVQANRTLERFAETKKGVQELARRVAPDNNDNKVSEDALCDSLSQLFQAIKAGCGEWNGGGINDAAASEAGIRRDVLDTWRELHQYHLPVSLALLRMRFAQLPEKTRIPDEPVADRPSVLLLMAGYSIEQLVLSIAINYYERDVRYVVPFAGMTSAGGHCWDAESIKKWLPHLGIYVGTESACEDDSTLLKISEPEVVVASNPARVFQSILNWARSEKSLGLDCWLDVTGGQKPMDSGASYAAMFFGWHAWYLDFAEYDGELRRPTPESLRYKKLVLPSVAFSHDGRREVMTHFCDRRFRSALERLSEITAWGRRPEFEEYFPQNDMNDFGQAEVTLRQCVALMGANYPAACLRSLRPTLYSHFEKEQKEENKEKETLRDMLHRLMKPSGTSDDDPFLQYLCDEFWRLETLLRLAEGHPQTDDLQVAYSEGIREVIVGSVGLAELIVDSLFQLPVGELTIRKVTSIESENVKKWLKDAALTQNFFESIQKEIEGKTLPVHRVPPAVNRSKAELIRGNSSKLTIWCPVTLFEKSGDSLLLASTAANELHSEEVVEYSSKKLILGIKASLSGQALVSTADNSDDWNLWFGDFGNSNGEWFGTRHLIAHMRAPMQRKQFDLAKRAINEYLPRFIGLSAIARQGSNELPMNADSTKTLGKIILENKKESIPWYASNAEESLRKQLQLSIRR